MTIAELLESRTHSFKSRGKMWIDEGGLAIRLYNSDHPDAPPVINLFAKTHGGWVGAYTDENPIVDVDYERDEIDRIIVCFAEKFGLELAGV